jgi:hypothetical protein
LFDASKILVIKVIFDVLISSNGQKWDNDYKDRLGKEHMKDHGTNIVIKTDIEQKEEDNNCQSD